MSKNDAATMQQSFPMNGGDGPHSYFNNSHYQRRASNVSMTTIEEAIAEKLDVRLFSSDPFRVADLGCSVGPNTFMAMQVILEAVENKYLEEGLKAGKLEFQVFFNDHSANDFNTLFASLPTDRRYFACGVPGTFHARLFPESSIHLMYSSYALQWLSKVPEELLDKQSPAWNRGRVHYTGASDELSHAYEAQFEHDMGAFLSARAKELVVGGMMVLIMPALPDGIPFSQITSGAMFDLLGASLMDMANAGLISEAQVDSFNLPVFAPSRELMTSLVKRNGCFTIEIMELLNPASKHGGSISGEVCAMHLRAGMEGTIAKHFGSEIIDELFDRVSKKNVEFSELLQKGYEEGTQMFAVLMRK